MPATLSPKQAARALGVSESSLKRWCDRGVLASTKTSGGHRKLPLDAVLRFVRESGHALPHPELLGLPAHVGAGQRTLGRARQECLAALLLGDSLACHQIILDLLVAGVSLSQVGDEVLSPTLQRIGVQWAEGATEVYCERRGVEACLRALYDIRHFLPVPRPGAPLAIGGTPDCDPYTLATFLVELVLRQCGWNAQSLGARLPFATLLQAIDDLQPRLCWLSVSHIDDESRFLREYEAFFEAAQRKVPVVVGGKALSESLRRQMHFSAYCDNLSHLEGFAAAAWPNETKRRRKKPVQAPLRPKTSQRAGGQGKKALVRKT